MEKIPQPNNKKEEEVNINEKITEYKDFINSLRGKYTDLLDASYRFTGSQDGGMMAIVDSAPTKPDRINWGLDSDDLNKLHNISGFVLNQTKGDLNNKSILFPFRAGHEGLSAHRLDWWFDVYDKALDFLVSPENIVD